MELRLGNIRRRLAQYLLDLPQRAVLALQRFHNRARRRSSVPARSEASRSACRTLRRKPSALRPVFDAIDEIGTGKILRILSNYLDASAQEIAVLYKRR